MASRGTPTRPFRIPDELYEAVQTKAQQDGVTVTSIVLAALCDYVGWTE